MFKKVYSLYSAFCTQPAFYSQSAVCILPLDRSLCFTLTISPTSPVALETSFAHRVCLERWDAVMKIHFFHRQRKLGKIESKGL